MESDREDPPQRKPSQEPLFNNEAIQSIIETTPSESHKETETTVSTTSRSSKTGEQDPERQKWGNQFQVVLTCIGFAVGLGNIWRFPKLAFENGGSAFLIPYLCCSFFFGLPGLYIEFLVGQYIAKGAPIGFRMYAPVLQGIGVCMITSSFVISLYYNTIGAWVVLYIYKTVEFAISGGDYKWMHCGNPWNTEHCVSHDDNAKCMERSRGNLTIFYNGTCHLPTFDLKKVATMNSGTEFFENEILRQNAGFEDENEVVWPIFYALVIVWTITILCMVFGVKVMGYVSYLTATVPYIIIAILFARGITLDGAADGVDYYIFKPQFEKILYAKTWASAISQVCFSLSVGIGGILTFASYSKRDHNCYRDAIIVCFADSFMSFFGGLSVFAVLGSLAKQQGKTVHELVEEGAGGTSLAFVTYPEATARMPAPWLFTLIFFFMLFLLGISSQIGAAGMVSTSLSDCYPNLFCYKGHFVATPLVCLVLWAIAQVMATKSGRYWFVFLDNYGAVLGLTTAATCEFLGICHVYGWRNLRADVEIMFGRPRNTCTKFIGKQGHFFFFCFAVVSPLLGTVVLVLSVFGMLSVPKIGAYEFPMHVHYAGWVVGLLGPLLIPLTIVYNARRLRKNGQPLSNLFLPERGHPSYDRIMSERRERMRSSSRTTEVTDES